MPTYDVAGPDKEVWENATPGAVASIKKINRRGDIDHERVRAGRKIVLSPHERQINQESASNEDLDMFRNGFLQPVTLVDTAEDYDLIKANPNLMTEDDLKALFKLSDKAFSARINKFTSEYPVIRMLAFAESEPDIKRSHEVALQDKLKEFHPRRTIRDPKYAENEFPFKPVSPG